MVDEDKFSFPHVAIAQGLLTTDQFRHCRSLQEEALEGGGKAEKIEDLAVKCGFMNDREVREFQEVAAFEKNFSSHDFPGRLWDES